MATTPDDTSAQGPRAALALDAALAAAADEQAAVNAAAGRRTVALARALAAAGEAPEALLDLEVERVATASVERRSSVARRALVAEVACALGVSEHVAQGWLADAETLASKAPRTLDMLCSGRISYRHAEKLADVVADLPVEAAARVEDAVLDRAATMTPARFGVLARRMRDLLHPIPAEMRREAAALKANVWVDDSRDGMSWLTAHLPTPVAHGIYDKLTRTASKAKTMRDPRGVGQLRAATMTALLLDGTHVKTTSFESVETTPAQTEPVETPSVEPRETRLRQAPPLDGLRRAQPPGPPDVPDPLETLARSVRPVVHVTVPVTTLTGTSEGSATLNGTIPVDAETARHLTARAPTLRRVLTDPVTGAMLTVDRRSYVVPADLRAFLTARDVTCRFPGCRIPAPRCDLDHTHAWANGGATDTDNLAALCRRHHTLKHESRWQVEQLEAGVLAWTSPAGRTYMTEPEATEAGITGPATSHHVLDQLDDWATEAQHLATEAPPTTRIERPAAIEPAAHGTDGSSSEPATALQHRDDDPPF